MDTCHPAQPPAGNTAVTDNLGSGQLLLFAFVCVIHHNDVVVQSQQLPVTAYFSSKLLFVFALWLLCQYSMAEENPAAQRQTAAVSDDLRSSQLLPFVSESSSSKTEALWRLFNLWDYPDSLLGWHYTPPRAVWSLPGSPLIFKMPPWRTQNLRERRDGGGVNLLAK